MKFLKYTAFMIRHAKGLIETMREMDQFKQGRIWHLPEYAALDHLGLFDNKLPDGPEVYSGTEAEILLQIVEEAFEEIDVRQKVIDQIEIICQSDGVSHPDIQMRAVRHLINLYTRDHVRPQSS